MSNSPLRLGTRGSLLARSQSAMIASQLMAHHPGLHVEMIFVKTTGDRITDVPLHEMGGKGLFVKELEEALLAGQVDFAVHSCKDVPVTMPLVDQAGLMIAAIPPRHDPRDVLVSLKASSIRELPQGANVGTTSLRRRCQLLAARPDLIIEPLRGNIDTRLRKLRESPSTGLRTGQIDAIILALAGIDRAGLMDEKIMHPLSTQEMLPAPAQGALALQCRRDDSRTREILAKLDDATTHTCVLAERAVVAALNGDCHSPIAALAQIEGGMLNLHVKVGAKNGQPPVLMGQGRSNAEEFQKAVDAAVEDLKRQGVEEIWGG